MGRDEGCGIRLDEPSVSRRHARFLVQDDRVAVEDLNSTNGTLVNGKRKPGAVTLRAGDTIKIGRRGSQNGTLIVHGKQGHVAYPHKGDNPVHRLMPALAELVATQWDNGNAHFPPTSFQISNLHSGTGANNVIPGEADVVFNFRYCTESTAEQLKARVHAVLDRHCPRYDADWWLSGEPFLTAQAELIDAAVASIESAVGIKPDFFTGGGTSDARFIAPWGAQTVEIGPINDSIHKINEHVNVADLPRLSAIYERILDRLL